MTKIKFCIACKVYLSNMRIFSKFTFILLFLIFACSISLASANNSSQLKGVELLSGFGLARLHLSQGYYRVAPLFLDCDFDLKPLLQKKSIHLPGLFQFVLEPFVAYVSRPNSNAEIGNSFLVKIGLLSENAKFQPYFKGGVGFVYTTQHLRAQGTQFDFNEYAGVGGHYFFQKNIALTLECRYRHLSNADIKQPNWGVDSHFIVAGISYLF